MLPFSNCLRNRHPSWVCFSSLVDNGKNLCLFLLGPGAAGSVITQFVSRKTNLEQKWLSLNRHVSNKGIGPSMPMKLTRTIFAFLACASTITLFTGCASFL